MEYLSIKVKFLFNKVAQLLKVSDIRQILHLMFSNTMGFPLTMVSSWFLTRNLGNEYFGDYSFLINIFNLSIIIFSFGFFQAAGRAIVITKKDSVIREYFGATLFILFGLFIIMSTSLYLYAFFDKNIKEKGLYFFFLQIIPFGFVFLYTRYSEVLLQSANMIRELSISRLYPKIIFVFFCLLYQFCADSKLQSLSYFVFTFTFSLFLVYIYILTRIRPLFLNIGLRLKEIWKLNCEFGIHVYIGSLFSVGAAQLSGVLVSYYSSSNANVGFYTLALSLCSPLTMIPNTIATAYYRKFYDSHFIPIKLTFYTISISILALVLLIIIAPVLVLKLYGSEFHPIISLIYILGLASLIYGMGDYYNRFLGANGKGKNLRNSALFVGVAILFINYLLLRRFGEIGAAVAFLGGGSVYLTSMLYYYWIYIRSKS